MFGNKAEKELNELKSGFEFRKKLGLEYLYDIIKQGQEDKYDYGYISGLAEMAYMAEFISGEERADIMRAAAAKDKQNR